MLATSLFAVLVALTQVSGQLHERATEKGKVPSLEFALEAITLTTKVCLLRKDTKSKFLIDERPQHSRTCSEKEPCKAKVEKHTGTAEKDDENYISCKPQLGSEPSTQNDWKSPIVAIPEDVYNNYTGIPRRILDKDGNPSPDLTCLNQICQKLKVKLRTSKDSEEMELRVVGIPAKKDSDVLIMGMPDFEYGKEVEWWIKA